MVHGVDTKGWVKSHDAMQDHGHVGVTLDCKEGERGWLGCDDAHAFMVGEGDASKQVSEASFNTVTFGCKIRHWEVLTGAVEGAMVQCWGGGHGCQGFGGNLMLTSSDENRTRVIKQVWQIWQSYET